MRTVEMVNSVGEHVAGETVELEDEEADRFVLLGYAKGDLSREFSDEERQELLAAAQVVNP
jgi:hypothetical protein